MVNIGPVAGQVPEPVNDRAQESVWSLVGDVAIGIPDLLYFLAEFLVSML